MAAANSAAGPLLQFYRPLVAGKLHTRRSILPISCNLTSLPTKPAKRKNYLRQKILKTLKKPIIHIDSPPQQDIEELEIQEKTQELENFEDSESGNQEIERLGEAEISSISRVSTPANVNKLDKNSILKYGLWLVVAFVFQTLCSVWVFGSTDFDRKNKILNGGKGNGEAETKVKLLFSENNIVDSAVYVDEVEIEKKIEEIRVMAREAREKERLELKKKSLDSEENNEKFVKSGIEEEVENRLDKLKKKLENAHEKMQLRKNNERKDAFENSEMDEKAKNAALTFKKKYKYKDFSSHQVGKPKGFTGSEANGVNSSNTVNLEKHVDLVDVDSKGSDPFQLVEEDKSKERGAKKHSKEDKGVAKRKVIDVKSRKLQTEAVMSIESGTAEIAPVSSKMLKGNNDLKGKAVIDNKSAQKFAEIRESETELWWSNLPYVLGILMYRGHNGAGGQGLYTLKSNSDLSRMVAFEDSVDATNFCYILQSFFEDLEDFQADVVPLTVKELNEAVKSDGLSVIVVKRGQLRLYAGQPLADAEMALRDMV